MYKNKLNKNGIIVTDKFILNYYGIIVVFEVAKTDTYDVYLYELKTKRKKDYCMLTKRLIASKKPYFVPAHSNTYEKTAYKTHPTYIDGKLMLPITIELYSPIYNEAIKNGVDFPLWGTAYAEPLKEYLGVYWEIKKYEDKRLIYTA